MIAKPLLALAASALLAGGTAASAQSAAPLSLSSSAAIQRSGAATQSESELGRGYSGSIVGIIAVGILIWVITELGDDNELPGSP